MEKATVTISYRDEGRGMGPFWDNHTIQMMTSAETHICYDGHSDIKDLVSFTEKIKAHPDRLPVFMTTAGSVPEADTAFGDDLLIIPGNTRKTEIKRPEVFKARSDFEAMLLKDAINRGRPVLAICGGSWRLWQALGGTSFRQAPGHDYPASHPRDDLRIAKNGAVIGNVMAHQVSVEKESILNDAMALKKQTEALWVNSIHWQVIDDSQMPQNVMISARSISHQPHIFLSWLFAFVSWLTRLLPLFNRFKPVYCEEHEVEAFETTTSAPMLGVQWHPEAFAAGGQGSRAQKKLFSYMRDAGEAFKKKQVLLHALKASPYFFKRKEQSERTPPVLEPKPLIMEL